MLHNSEGNSSSVGNGCCDRSLVIYTAALTEEWTARLPRRPQVLPRSTQQKTQMGALCLGDIKGADRRCSKRHFTMFRPQKLS